MTLSSLIPWRRKESKALARRAAAHAAVGLPTAGPGGHFATVAPQYDSHEALSALRQVRSYNQQLDQLTAGMMQWLLDHVEATGATPDEQRELVNAVVGRFQVVFTDWVQGRVTQQGLNETLKASAHRG